LPASLGDHFRVGVETDDLLVQRREQKRDLAGPAADVEQPPATVEAELLPERVGELRGVREAPGAVVARAAGEERQRG